MKEKIILRSRQKNPAYKRSGFIAALFILLFFSGSAQTGMPVWPLVKSSPTTAGVPAEAVDWRPTAFVPTAGSPTVNNIGSFTSTLYGSTTAAFGDCGVLEFYALHTGTVNSSKQLLLYDKGGVLIPTTPTGFDGDEGDDEMQMVKVPGKADEWYLIYSEYSSSPYDSSRILYTHLKYTTGTMTVIGTANTVLDNVGSGGDKYMHPKAVSIPDASGNYVLYTYKRLTAAFNQVEIESFAITASGITYSSSTKRINDAFWPLTNQGSVLELNRTGTKLALMVRDQSGSRIHVYNTASLSTATPTNYTTLGDLLLEPDGIVVTGSTPQKISDLATTNASLTFLVNFSSKVANLEFSPNGSYLYFSGGGYSSSGSSNITYLAQLNLNNSHVRLQIQKPVGVYNINSGQGDAITAANTKDYHAVGCIEASFDNNLYFIRSSSTYLYVIPNPNGPMAQSLTPGDINLEDATHPNILLKGNPVVLPDGIDGYDYRTGGSLMADAGLPQTFNFCTQTPTITLGKIPNTATGGGGSGTYNYDWKEDNGGGQVAGATLNNYSAEHPTAKPNSTTTYTVTVTSGSCVATSNVKITVVGGVSITHTVSPHSSYAGARVLYSVLICNNTAINQTVTVNEFIPAGFIFENQVINPSDPNPFGMSTPGTSTPYTLVVTPGCHKYEYVGHYNVYQSYQSCYTMFDPDCMVQRSSCDTYTAMYGCPTVLYNENITNCDDYTTPIDICFNLHTFFSDVQGITTTIIYPNYLTPLGTATLPSGVTGYTVSLNKFTISTYDATHNQVAVDVQFSPIINLGPSSGHSDVFCIPFKLNSGVTPPSNHDFISAANNESHIIGTTYNDKVFTAQGAIIFSDQNNTCYPNVLPLSPAFIATPQPTCDLTLNFKSAETDAKLIHNWVILDDYDNLIWGADGGSANFQYVFTKAGTYHVTHFVLDPTHQKKSARVTQTVTISSANYDYPYGVIISNVPALSLPNSALTLSDIKDVNGDGVIKIRGTLTIKQGNTFTISGKTVEFGKAANYDPEMGIPGSAVIVEPSARLILSNKTILKGVSDCGTMWEGVVVMGDPGAVVGVDPKTTGSAIETGLISLTVPRRNGTLIMNDATIRDAYSGVRLFNPYNLPEWPSNADYGRGLIQANSSRFINNAEGVVFRSRTSIQNPSTFVSCQFLCDAPLLDQSTYNGGGINSFVTMVNVNGLVFSGNSFKGFNTLAAGTRGTGIRSFNAGYKVQALASGLTSLDQNLSLDSPTNSLLPSSAVVLPSLSTSTPNSFLDLDKGIDAYANGTMTSKITVKGNSFNNVIEGITSNRTSFDDINRNTFLIPAGLPGMSAWGINCYGSGGYMISENTLTAASPAETYGILVNNTAIGTQVYKNTFAGDFYVATQAENNNSNLQIGCNTYQGSNNYDWAVVSGTLASQGACRTTSNPSAKPAGNKFAACTTADQSQIFKSPTAAAFSYSSYTDQAPTCVSNGVTTATCALNGASSPASCPSKINVPCVSPACLTAFLADITLNTTNSLTKTVLTNDYVRAVLENNNVLAAEMQLGMDVSDGNIRILVPTYLAEGNCTKASELMNKLSPTLPNSQFADLYKTLISACYTGRSYMELNIAEKNAVANIAATNTSAAVDAQTIIAALETKQYQRIPEAIKIASTQRKADPKAPESGSVKENVFSIIPNPVTDIALIKFAARSTGKIVITDLLGKKVKEVRIQREQSEFTLETSKLQQGIYFVTLFDNEILLGTTKMVVNK